MSEDPVYYTRKTLAELVGVSPATFDRHERLNVGRLLDIRERIPGLGIRFQASKCKRYIALCRAAGRKPKAECPP